MSPSWQIGTAKCSGQVQAYINQPLRAGLTTQVMQDYQRCLAFVDAGRKGLRANFLAMKTKNNAEGGLQSALSGYKEHIDEKGVWGKKGEIWLVVLEAKRVSANLDFNCGGHRGTNFKWNHRGIPVVTTEGSG